MAMQMFQFKKWWDKVSMEGDWDYEQYAEIGWQAALELVLNHRYEDTDESLYDILQRELGNEEDSINTR